jgi:4-amino-4-deoxy-L-arabinose transferase-like glycosyltransferase
MNSRWIIVILLLIGSGLRMVRIEQTPPGFYLDEASVSYDAFSLWTTGHDQHGTFFPVALRSFNDFRPPLFSYFMAPLVGFAGLSVAVARLSSVYWGLLSIAALYWVGSIFFNRRVGLTAAFLLVVSPWHVHFSRLAIEVNMAAFFVLLTVGLFYRWVRHPEPQWLWGAAAIAGLSLYTYAILKLSIPLIMAVFAVTFWKKLRSYPLDLCIAIGVGCLIAGPLVFLTLVNPGSMQSHFRQISVFQPGSSVIENIVDIGLNFWANISPSYLFSESSSDIVLHPPGMGQLYGVQFILILLGVIFLVRKQEWRLPGGLVLCWIATSIFPAALTLHNLGTGHPQRTYPVVIAWQLLSAVGFAGLYQWLRSRILQILFVLVTLISILGQGLLYFRYYFTAYSDDAAPQFYAGVNKLVDAVRALDDNYSAVYYSTHGNDLPYIHFLFYSQYDPHRLLDTPLITHSVFPDRVVQMGKYRFTDQVKDLYLSGLPGLFILGAGEMLDIGGVDVLTVNTSISSFAIIGRERLFLETYEWLGQCNQPVAPMTYDVLAPATGSLWLANFDCTTTWIYPASGMTARAYILHRDMAVHMNDFTFRHIARAPQVLSLPEQVIDVGPFMAYEQHELPAVPTSIQGVGLPAETRPDIDAVHMEEAVSFAGTLNLTGIRLFRDAGYIEVETWWSVAEDSISRPVSVMAHLLDETGYMLDNADGLGLTPHVLRKGDIFVQRHVFQKPSDIQSAWLRLGVYWLDTMERWPISGDKDANAFFIYLSGSE